MRKIVFFITVPIIIFSIFACKEDKSTAPQNKPPIIKSINVASSNIQINQTTELTCDAIDPDYNEIEFIWDSNDGTFPVGFIGSSVKWKAPDTEGTYKIEVSVTDGEKITKKEKNIEVKLPSSTHPCDGIEQVEYEGKIYNTIEIGEQCWFKENLNVGEMLQSNQAPHNNGVIEKYCYDDDTSNCAKYGGLYNWKEVMSYGYTAGTQGICPSGWHIPTQEDFDILDNFAADSSSKLIDTTQITSGYESTNELGFSALFAGYRNGSFMHMDSSACFWSSNHSMPLSDISPISLKLSYDYIYISMIGPRKSDNALSVRCIKN